MPKCSNHNIVSATLDITQIQFGSLESLSIPLGGAVAIYKNVSPLFSLYLLHQRSPFSEIRPADRLTLDFRNNTITATDSVVNRSARANPQKAKPYLQTPHPSLVP